MPRNIDPGQLSALWEPKCPVHEYGKRLGQQASLLRNFQCVTEATCARVSTYDTPYLVWGTPEVIRRACTSRASVGEHWWGRGTQLGRTWDCHPSSLGQAPLSSPLPLHHQRGGGSDATSHSRCAALWPGSRHSAGAQGRDWVES